MSWRERTKGPASFRGVPFFVDTSERSGGRRTVTHEYPLRDEPFVEDMGRRARAFPVEGYVVGESYLAQRDALIAALEEAGPGELVHPYHGTRRVACNDFTIRESTAEGGMARFRIDFVETLSRPASPVAVVDPASAVRESAALVRRASGAEFLREYRPGTLLDSAHTMLRTATLRINNVISTAHLASREAALLQRRVDELLGAAVGLVRTPGNLLAQIQALFGLLSGGVALAAYTFDTGPRPPETTASRRQERRNHVALQAVIQRLALARAAETAPDVSYDSHDAAVAAREAIAELLDEQLDRAGEETYPALQQLGADLARALPSEDARLPRLLRHVPPQTVPSLVLAHRLYGDVSLEGDLLRRNRILHPGFVRGGDPLEVRARG